MNFNCQMILTGLEKRTGKNGEYVLITALTPEGKTQDFLWKGKNLDLTMLKKMETYDFELSVYFGKFINLNVVDIKKVA